MKLKNKIESRFTAGRCVVMLVLTLALMSFTQSIQSVAGEYNLKAAFVYNFTRYIEWDKSTIGNEFTIGVIGPSPISQPLGDIARSKTVNDKKITIRQFNKPEEINSCNMLFISGNAPYSLNEILAKVPQKGMLTVSEKNNYASKGTAINFVIVEDKLKFEANVKTINSAGLTASSQLLKLAIIVE
jgi:hypothetical protein